MMTSMVEQIATVAELLSDPLRQKLWEYAELLYVEQVAYDTTEPAIAPGEQLLSADLTWDSSR